MIASRPNGASAPSRLLRISLRRPSATPPAPAASAPRTLPASPAIPARPPGIFTPSEIGAFAVVYGALLIIHGVAIRRLGDDLERAHHITA